MIQIMFEDLNFLFIFLTPFTRNSILQILDSRNTIAISVLLTSSLV